MNEHASLKQAHDALDLMAGDFDWRIRESARDIRIAVTSAAERDFTSAIDFLKLAINHLEARGT